MHICATLQVYINSQGILNKEEKNMSKKTGLIAMVISVVSLICSIASIANMMQMKAAQAVPALEAVQETAGYRFGGSHAGYRGGRRAGTLTRYSFAVRHVCRHE